MMFIISTERIAFCAQVEGTRGEIFAMSPIAFQMRACTQWTHSDVWSQLAPTPECLLKIRDRQSEKNRWNSDWRAICNATHGIETGCGAIRHRGVSEGSDGARPLWRSLSARTEIFFADVDVDICIPWWTAVNWFDNVQQVDAGSYMTNPLEIVTENMHVWPGHLSAQCARFNVMMLWTEGFSRTNFVISIPGSGPNTFKSP